MGMAAPDYDGRMVSVASVGLTVNSASYKQSLTRFVKFEAPRNAKVNIKPHADCFVSTFDTQERTVIDFKEQSKDAGPIPFTDHPGKYGAVITYKDDGAFDIKIVNGREEYLDLIKTHKEGESTLEQKVGKLEKQL